MAYKYDDKYILDGSRKLYEFDGKYVKKYCGTRIAQYKDFGEAFIKVLALEGLL